MPELDLVDLLHCMQARLVTALGSVLPGIPASNFTLVNAVESQPAQVLHCWPQPE